MKKFVFLFVLCFIFLGCTQGTYYTLTTEQYIDNEDKGKYQNCVSDIVKSASFHLTTSDYERVDDTINKAKEVCDKIYLREKTLLQIETVDDNGVVIFRKKYMKNECIGKNLEMYNKLFENPQIIFEEGEIK